MSKVKWVLHTNLTAHELQYANGSPMGKQIPVIPLADLGELVEGLRDGYTGDFAAYRWACNDILAKLEAVKK